MCPYTSVMPTACFIPAKLPYYFISISEYGHTYKHHPGFIINFFVVVVFLNKYLEEKSCV